MSTLLHLLKVELFVPLFSPCSSVPLSLNSRLIIHCLCFNGTDGGREFAGSAVVALDRAENLPAVQSISSIGWVFFGAGAFFCLGLTCFEPASAGAAGFGGMAKQLGARRNLFMKGNLQTKGPPHS